MKYIAIVGSREFKNLKLIKDFILTLPKEDIVIVSGGAPGADSYAELIAKQNKYPTIVFRANWERDGRKAGFLRNIKLVDFIKENKGDLHAFWDIKSRGTKHTIELCLDLHSFCWIHFEDGYVEHQEEIPF